MHGVSIIAFLLGMAIIGTYGIIEHVRFKRRIKALSSELRDQEDELNSLRNLPITSDDVTSGPVNDGDI